MNFSSFGRLCRAIFASALTFSSLLLAGGAHVAGAQSQSGFTYNGIVYTSYQNNEYLQTPQGPQGTAAIRATGANYTSVMVTQYMLTSTSNVIAPETSSSPGYDPQKDPLSPTDAAVAAAIKNAQAQGLIVFLKPQVDSNDGVYRGNFAPTDPAAWFASYTTFILHYAQLAVDNHVGGLVIGTELASLSHASYLSYWEPIIAQLRSKYPSLLLAYGANATYSGDEFSTVSFYNLVDLIGVDGYFPLTNQSDPTVAQLVAAWTNNKSGFNIVSALKALSSKYSKPVIFTELGYVSAPGTNIAPYSSAAQGAAYDPTEQANCYEAFFEVFSQQTAWMKGVFWWDWSVSPPGANDTGYSSQGKPAATVTLPKWFGSTTPGFTIAPANSLLSVSQGLSATDTIAVTNQGGFTGAVTLTATNLPTGVTASFAAGSAAGTQILTLTATSGASFLTTNVMVTGTSGTLAASTSVALSVQAATSQTITFNNPGAQVVGTPLTLVATTTSGLPLTFISSTSSVCTASGNVATFLSAGTCTIAASQPGNATYAPAIPVPQSFNVTTLTAVPVPAAANVIVSQVNWLAPYNGNAYTSGNPDGSSIAVNANGAVVAANSNNLLLFDGKTGAATTLGPWASASAVAVDSQNNIYVGNLYGPVYDIVKLPYVGGTANGGYAPFATPTAGLATCTPASTTECALPGVGSVNPGALAFDAAGDLFWATANSNLAPNGIYECSVACLGGTGAPVEVYSEPTASPAPSASSGQLLIGALTIDAANNIFFTDSSIYVDSGYGITSFNSYLKELPVASGVGFGGVTTGYAASPSLLYTVTPSSINPYNTEISAVTYSAKNATVYFAVQTGGVYGFPDSGKAIPTANGQPTAMYAVATQGAKGITADASGNLYFLSYSSVLSSGGDTLGEITVDQVTVPISPVNIAISPSATVNPVTTLLNDTACSATPVPAVTFAGTSANASATVATTGSCASTLNGGASFNTNVSFTPTAGGADAVTLTGTDQGSNTGSVVVNGLGQAPLTAQTITFNNVPAQVVGTPLTLAATASSGLAVTFTSATTPVCTIAGATATFVTAGTCTIDANQAGNTTYAAAAQVQQSFNVTAAPSFTIAPVAASAAVLQGGTATATIDVTGANGFSGPVTLAASGLPAGVTASFGTNPATSTSVVTFTATATATTGPAMVTINGTSGSLTASTTVALTVSVPPSFTLVATAKTLGVLQGNAVTDTVTVTPANGFSSAVTLAASGLPAGVTASFGTNPATGSSLLTFTASGTATTGLATVTVTGTSGSLSASTTIALTVNLPPSFTLKATAPAASVIQGATATDAVTVTPANGFTGAVTLAATGLPAGVTASFGTNPATGTSVVTFTATSTATTGLAMVTVTGTSVSLTASTTIALTVNVPASFTLAPAAAIVSVVQGSAAIDTITVTPANGFTGSVTLAATGLPAGLTASFGTNPTTGASAMTLTATSAAATGTTMFTVTGTSGTLTESTAVSVTVTPAPSFTLAPAAAAVAVVAGGTATETINVTGANSFSGAVNLAATGLPAGVSAAFATNPATGSSVLTLTATSAAAVGTTTVTVTGTSGSLTAATSFALTVTAAPGFTLGANAPSVTVAAGATATDALSIAGTNGFSGSVTLSAAIASSPSGAQDLPTFSFGATSPVSVTAAGGGNATLTISTTAATSAAMAYPQRGGEGWRLAGGTALAGLLLLCLPRRRRKLPVLLGMMVCLLALGGGLVGCGGSGGGTKSTGNPGTTAGTYSITVTATSGTTTATLPVTLTVQ